MGVNLVRVSVLSLWLSGKVRNHGSRERVCKDRCKHNYCFPSWAAINLLNFVLCRRATRGHATLFVFAVKIDREWANGWRGAKASNVLYIICLMENIFDGQTEKRLN